VTRTLWLLWLLLSVALFGAFLFFVVADYPFRTVIAVQ
jgi:nitrate reductase NapE component